MMPPLVVATASRGYPVDMVALRSGLGRGVKARECALPRGPMTLAEEDAAAEALSDADGLLVRVGYIGPRLIRKLPRLRVITLHGVGVDQVDLPTARAAGITVTNVPGANAQAVAEHTFALMLAVLRRVCRADAALRAGDWEGGRTVGQELGGKTLGLVGLGSIGMLVARIADAFGMRVQGHNRSGACALSFVHVTDLDNLLRSSDIVSLHVPQSAETMGLLSAKRIAEMKPTAILVNTARGALVDEAALCSALATGRLAGAGLDVFAAEPPAVDNPLLRLDNVVLTPHIASSTGGALYNIALRAGQDMERVLTGREPLHRVV